MCGETVQVEDATGRYRGLSPRVRGNLGVACYLAMPVRSIPACAGKPDGADVGPGIEQVYPRVCGETTGVL